MSYNQVNAECDKQIRLPHWVCLIHYNYYDSISDSIINDSISKL